jgi:uncharacterized protein (DUF2267 family)
MIPFEEFATEIRRRCAELASNVEAVEAIRAVLSTLSECLPGGVANELAAQLPVAAGDGLRREEWKPGEQLTLSEFLLRVSQRAGVPESEGRACAEAVMSLLRRAADPDTFDRLRAELPADYDALWGQDPGQVHMHQPVA